LRHNKLPENPWATFNARYGRLIDGVSETIEEIKTPVVERGLRA
jgi:hypothetical protein